MRSISVCSRDTHTDTHTTRTHTNTLSHTGDGVHSCELASDTHLRFVCTNTLKSALPLSPHQDGGLFTLLPLAQHSGGLELAVAGGWLVRC